MGFRLPRLVPRAAIGLAALALATPSPAQDGLAGAYLAARQASMYSDYTEAARYYALALAEDPGNPALLENAMMAYLGLGDVERAIPIARRLESGANGSQVANLVIIADQMKRGAWDEAMADLEAGRSAAPLVDSLIRAWARFGQGRMSEALDAFDAASEQTGLKAFGLYHKALALAAAGDFEGADHILSGEAEGPLRATRRGVIAHAEVLSQLERHADAIELIDSAFGLEVDPGISDLRARLAAGKALPFDVVEDATQGAAEVFYTVAGALNGDAMDSYTLIYARLAEYLAPGNSDAVLLSASLLESQERYALAIDTYARVPRDDPAFYAAEIGRAEAMRKAGDVDGSIAVLQALSRDFADVAIIHVTLGDTLRGQERHDEARQAYDRAIALFDAPARAQWIVYYARGVAHERLGLWDKAEADFRQALELEPDQPQVLNYLGYSFVELKTNLDEALDMIERAVAARPDDGYITDSLGWVLYRLGRYDEAVPHMEKAAALMPIDPIVNDHLGDVYWAVGRKNEARFQWHRALSFDPEEKEADRIRRKLEIGLDRVLQEEGAPPLQSANDG
ncbi:tetratricopeptide repeat protein [Rhodovulum euryhalinum]|uniref:Tetratricopeptide repeat protein n=1 Tax=Rhodovulum euryhalinum TaxID=35805 RepID=A0A4R2KGV7_9RHOB|nr:tetratricopeptide repeat protein [Rhodovulum euryhalinum]TCO73001.1 tetratricopeptide repeat protein [Rhodovulum euryhalinum]